MISITSVNNNNKKYSSQREMSGIVLKLIFVILLIMCTTSVEGKGLADDLRNSCQSGCLWSDPTVSI